MKTYNKSEIMKKAWNRFKMFSKHTGETFGQSLKIVWNNARALNYTVGEEVRDNQMKGYWVASISGLHPQFGFARDFVSEREVSSTSCKHRYFNIVAKLVPGTVYELCEKYDRRFVTVEKGELVELSKEQVKARFE